MFDKLLVIDGSYMLHRALRVEEISNLKDSKGRPTGGLMQFLRSMNYAMRSNRGYYPVVCFDSGLSPRRTKLHPEYKHYEQKQSDIANKIEPDNKEYLDLYVNQRSLVSEAMEILGVPVIHIKNWEGDDLIYLTTKIAKDSVVVTDDKDMIQLLSPTCKIYRVLAKEVLEYNSYQLENNDPYMNKFIIEKAIVGDPSDNISQVAPKVGYVSAKVFAELFNSNPGKSKELLLEEFIEDPSNGGRIRNAAKRVKENLDILERNIALTDLKLVEEQEDVDYCKKTISSLVPMCINKPIVPIITVAKYLGQYEVTGVDISEILLHLKIATDTNKGV